MLHVHNARVAVLSLVERAFVMLIKRVHMMKCWMCTSLREKNSLF